MHIPGLTRLLSSPEIIEGAAVTIGFLTSKLLIPLLSGGRILVDSAPKGVKVIPRWHGANRAEDGRIVLDAELAAMLGLVVWGVVAAIVGWLFFWR